MQTKLLKEEIYRFKKSVLESIEDAPDAKSRILIFKESLKTIEDKYPEEEGMYRAEICNFFIITLYKIYKESYKLSCDELAIYLSEMMNNIGYVEGNVPLAFFDYKYFYHIWDVDFISHIVKALDENMPEGSVKSFMNSVVRFEYFDMRLERLVDYFDCVVQMYTAANNYKEVVDYAQWFIQVYKERKHSCKYLGYDTFKKSVDTIYCNMDKACKALHIKATAEHEAKMADIRKREAEALQKKKRRNKEAEALRKEQEINGVAETPKQRQDREKAELYDLAQRCKAAGDEAGYCGYMSALGDIGR